MSMDGDIESQIKRSPDFNKGSMILADGLNLATDDARSLYDSAHGNEPTRAPRMDPPG